MSKTLVRWSFCATDQSKQGTVEEIDTDDVPYLVQCGNVVVVDPTTEEGPVPAAQAETPSRVVPINQPIVAPATRD